MIKRLLISALTLFSISTANAQQLANTYWMVYDYLNVFTVYCHFDGTALSFSSDNITYFPPVANYYETGNLLEVVDIQPGTCAAGDTGKYFFSIQNDTLEFTLIVDSCSARKSFFIDHYLTNLTTGITADFSNSAFQLFPNPFSDNLTVKMNNQEAEMLLYDITGKIILKKICNGITTLSTTTLAKGIYIYRVQNTDGLFRTGKIIKQ